MSRTFLSGTCHFSFSFYCEYTEVKNTVTTLAQFSATDLVHVEFTYNCFCKINIGKRWVASYCCYEIVLISQSPWKGLSDTERSPQTMLWKHFVFNILSPFHSHKFWNQLLNLHILIHTYTHTNLQSFSLGQHWIFGSVCGKLTYCHAFTYPVFI